MDPAEKRIKELRRIIEEANTDYYELDMPRMVDSEYDALVQELEGLEKDHPELDLTGSPTGKVGGRALEKFPQYPHRYPLISLGNAFSYEELRAFDARVQKGLEEKKVEYIAELKIDGLSIALIYKEGKLQVGATRGDGAFGEDVTRNIQELSELPKSIEEEGAFEVRGEVFMDYKTFDALNENREIEGLPLFRNPRNGADRKSVV